MSLLASFGTRGQLRMQLVPSMLEKSSTDIDLIRGYNLRASSARRISSGMNLILFSAVIFTSEQDEKFEFARLLIRSVKGIQCSPDRDKLHQFAFTCTHTCCILKMGITHDAEKLGQLVKTEQFRYRFLAVPHWHLSHKHALHASIERSSSRN